MLPANVHEMLQSFVILWKLSFRDTEKEKNSLKTCTSLHVKKNTGSEWKVFNRSMLALLNQ